MPGAPRRRILSTADFRHPHMPPAPESQSDLTPDVRDAVLQSRKQFVAAASAVRPRLHRFCARMCGSSLDGEDIVQETLAEAFYNLPALKDPARFEPWLFRIAYHKCIDFLRRERGRNDTVLFDEEHDQPGDASGYGDALDDTPIDDALATLVHALPPKERASVLLKDVLDYPIAEVAGIVDSTVGGVKAALHRARAKLRTKKAAPALAEMDGEQRRLFEAYAEVFNRRDWDALKQLVRADARLEIVGAAQGIMSGLGATYSTNYTALKWEWRLAPGVVDGLPVIVHWRRDGNTWRPHAAIRLWWRDGAVVRIRDYNHVEYLLTDWAAASLPLSGAPS
jgi:RNA polymerase sigma-70 factor, ECF subfamily